MTKKTLEIGAEVVVQKEGLQELLDALKLDAYRTIGPKVFNNAIIYEEIGSVSDLPVGWNDFQEAGTYQLKKSQTKSLFGYALGPQSWKKYLHPPTVQLWKAKRTDTGFQILEEEVEIPKYAFIGVRSCEIEAISILDKVFNTNEYSDPIYNSMRESVFIVAVNCTKPGGTCFCTSMKTGPKVRTGFDIALTEIPINGGYGFIAQAGSIKGANIFKNMVHREAKEKEKDIARRLLEEAGMKMGRSLNISHLKEIFYENFEHPQWEKVAERCLTCGNCTMVCPTCFCYNVKDINDLKGEDTERWRKWDSCFSQDFSYIHGGSIRASLRSRYRQWLTHKLSTWVDQFGTFGCVGCGRCITWCPVGIDITEEAKAILGETAGSTP
jgi:sulfhydrogenase subunit beta (sulfur reductase)